MTSFGCRIAFAHAMVALVLVTSTSLVAAQPSAPAPPPPTPTPSPSPQPPPPTPNPQPDEQPVLDVPAPNPSAPPPGTEPAPTPATTTTTPPPGIDASAQTALEKQSAHEKRLAAAAACNAHSPTCDWIATFSSLELLSIRRSLAALGLEIESAPWTKVISKIRIYNEDVFAEHNLLSLLNYFHYTTTDQTIRSLLTINEGEAWNDELIAESARNLKDPLFTGVVVLLPVKSAEADKVDLLVVTRDIWSLRLNTRYGIQQGTLTDLSISLSENNFLGRRKTIAFSFLVDQGAITTGPLYIDKNFLREHIDFRFGIGKIFTRQSLPVVAQDPPDSDPAHFMSMPSGDPGGLQDERKFHSEGSYANVGLTKQLWSLASKWGWGGSFSYKNAISRSYLGTGLRAVDNPDTPEVEYLAREYRMRSWNVSGSVTRQWGRDWKQQVEMGYGVSSQTPSLLSNFPDDPAMQAYFKDVVFPHTEVISNPYVEYTIYRANFRTIRNVDTFDLAEDLRVGPNLTVGLAQSLTWLGSSFNFTRPSLTMGWTFPWTRDGFVRISAGGALRIQPGDRTEGQTTPTIDNTATAQIRVATPTVLYGRLLAQVHTETRWNDTQNAFYSLGSDSGLRAYNIAQFIGNRRVVGQLEWRTIPYPFWVLRLGAVAFYEVGGVAASYNTMQLHQDVGVGLRMLIPQTARDLFRFDFAKPLDGGHGCPIPGNICFIAGFDSYF